MSPEAPPMQHRLASRAAHAAPWYVLFFAVWWLSSVAVAAIIGPITAFRSGIPLALWPLIAAAVGLGWVLMSAALRHDPAACAICAGMSEARLARRIRNRRWLFRLHHLTIPYVIGIALVSATVTVAAFVGGITAVMANVVLYVGVAGAGLYAYADITHRLYLSHCCQVPATAAGRPEAG